MHKPWHVVALVTLTLVAVAASQDVGVTVEKRVVSTAVLTSNDVPTKATCDSKRNIYLRLFDPAKRDTRPIMKFDSHGELQATFTSPHLAELDRILGAEVAFGVLPNGGIVT